MKDSINLSLVYKGECLGCKHLHRINNFSFNWICDKTNPPIIERNLGRNMKKCDDYEHYTEKRCIDCSLSFASCSNPSYWHCKGDSHSINYDSPACSSYNKTVESFLFNKKKYDIMEEIRELESKKRWYLKRIEELNIKIEDLNNQCQNLH